ncbi:hypothetical protein Daus18300_002258 [Diaporthe australafricana]|uniref:Carboxylic ester hydrolase n=1 Tax=Diaporthe australafricana TaxID=127596 RepID=A0ABR3XQA9_9PEZI
MGSEPPSPEELELSPLIHTDPPGSGNLENTEEPSQDSTTPSADDSGQPAAVADGTAMQVPNEMSVAVPSASRPSFPWTFEAGYLVVAIAALTATVAVLAKFHNQEQPHWPYADMLNLSALIAILATLLRSMITLILEALIGQLKWYWYRRAHPVAHLQAFDEASRGAWGSSKFLLQIHAADWPSVSAIFMVLSIGIGTFTQLALRTMPCSMAVRHVVASIPTAHMFFTPEFEFVADRSGNEVFKLLQPTLDVFKKTAIINGLSGLQSLGAVSASCDTSNCSFTTYGNITHSTFGIESMCVDVSPFLTQTDNSTISLGSGDSSNKFIWTNYTFHRGYPSISYLVEGDSGDGAGTRWYPSFSFDSGAWTFHHEEHLIKRSFYGNTFVIPTLSPCLERSVYPLTPDPLPLINTSSCPQLGMTNVSTFPGYFSLAAVQCHLYPSIRHYAGSIVNGQIQERLIGDPVPLDYGTNATGVWKDYMDMNELLYYAFLDPCLIEGTVYTNANISQVPGDRITIRRRDNSEITGPKLCLYGASFGSLYALSDVLDSFAFAQIDNPLGPCKPNSDYTGMNCLSMWWLEPLFNGGNASFDSVSAVMSRMADAITNQLRMNGTDMYGNPSNVTGTAFHTVVCTQFQWGWLLFPASGVLASAVLLFATAWKSSSQQGSAQSSGAGSQVVVPVWKSSLLPLLYYGLEDRARLGGAPLENKEVSELGGQMVARLSFEDDGLRFRD